MASIAQKKAPKKYLHIKHCIKKMQCRAKWVGTLYVIAMAALFALACMQPVTFADGSVGVFSFWKPFTLLTKDGGLLNVIMSNLVSLTIALLYAIMLLVLLINFIGALCNMGWLYKKKASKLYGFNRNMYAMDDIEKAYSSSFKAIVCIYFLIATLAVDVRFNLVIGGALIGLGVFFHFLCGLLAGNTSLFTVDGEIIEEKRKVGTFGAFVRNLFQIVFTAAFVFFFIKSAGAIRTLMAGESQTSIVELKTLVLLAARVLLLIFGVCMICYALGTREFEPTGRETAGRKSFAWMSFMVFLFALGTTVFYAICYKLPLDALYVAMAGIALVAFILDVCLRKFPKSKEKNPDDVDANKYLDGTADKAEEQEILFQPQILPPIYLPMSSQGQDNQN